MKPKFTTEGVVDMEQTFYVGMKICDYYAIHINDDGYERKEMVQENEIDGFVHCLKFLGYQFFGRYRERPHHPGHHFW